MAAILMAAVFKMAESMIFILFRFPWLNLFIIFNNTSINSINYKYYKVL